MGSKDYRHIPAEARRGWGAKKMIKKQLILLTSLCLFALGTTALAQQGTPVPEADPSQPSNPKGDKWFGKKDKKPDKMRTVVGVVKDPKGEFVQGAVVRLKDTKTLEVRSFITLKNGEFRFHGLSMETDYELQATYQGDASRKRRLTVFDSRKKATMDLKIEEKKG
jgi:carboxypeptidase family protein